LRHQQGDQDEQVKDQTMTHQTEQAAEAETTPTYFFSARELTRLAVYRAAIVAGFYNEQLDLAEFPIRQTPHTNERRGSHASH
jgi:hypothetical protein